MQHLTRSLCSGSITEPSTLVRIVPPQCSTSVLSPRGCDHLCFSLCIRTTGSCSSVRKPASNSCPLYAGRRPPSNPISCRLFSEVPFASDFDGIVVFTTRDRRGCLRSSHSPSAARFSPYFSSNAHDHDS